MNEFKDILVYLRKRSDMTQQDLAKVLGLSKSMISMYERGERHPSYEMLEAIADHFNVNVDFLIGRDQKKLAFSERAFVAATMYEELSDDSKDIVDAIIRLQLAKEHKDEKEG